MKFSSTLVHHKIANSRYSHHNTKKKSSELY